MVTIKDVIDMKSKKMKPFGTQYRWLFMTLEDYLISKSDGGKRVKQFLDDYDDTARLYILHQFEKLGEYNIVNELMSLLEIEKDRNVLDDIYSIELMDTLEF